MSPDLRAYLLDNGGNRVFGPGPADLLERVERMGSLRAAAMDMGMAYTKAMRLVRDAERAFGFPLTERTVGGPHGGGSVLTAQARDLLRRYRAFERSSKLALAHGHATCFSGFNDVPRLGCVVMASGEGRRFSDVPGQKLTVPLAGIPVLERTIASIPSDVFDIVVVSRWPAVRRLCARLGVTCVEPSGMRRSDTVRAGLDALGERSGCLFIPGDQALVREESLRAMALTLQQEPRAIVRLAWQGAPSSPVLWPADGIEALRGLTGDEGGTALLEGHAELAGRVRLVEAADAWEVVDVDDRGNLAQLEAALVEREERQ